MGIQFILALLGIGATYLESLKNKSASEAGNVIDLVDQATIAVLQENAKIKGLTFDWNDPAAVQGFISTLPAFTPISSSSAPASAGDSPAPPLVQAPAADSTKTA